MFRWTVPGRASRGQTGTEKTGAREKQPNSDAGGGKHCGEECSGVSRGEIEGTGVRNQAGNMLDILQNTERVNVVSTADDSDNIPRSQKKMLQK